jgi:F-type H+-transporting ATPase subunit c
VKRYMQLVVFFSMLLLFATPAMAQGENPAFQGSGALGCGLVAIGAAFGIGKLSAAAFESMARQPETAGTIFTTTLVTAALIEGFTFFALFICMQQNPFAAG